MSSPLILVAPGTQHHGPEFSDYSVALSETYSQALVAVGGIPWILSYAISGPGLAECVRRCDGVLLTGGDDIQPDLYTKKLAPRLRKTIIDEDPVRDLAEISLIQEVFRQRKPLLAICRGHQILHVAFGGSLIVDIRSEIPGAIEHSQMEAKDRQVHPVRVESDTLLLRLLKKETIGVNSTHHQAVKQVIPPFRLVASSSDGVIEAMELGLADRHLLPYLLAVQFHPERLVQRHPEFLEIFRSFTRACTPAKKRSI